MDRVAMLKLQDQAFRKIQKDAQLWKQWHECKTEIDRELLMTWAVFEIVHARGYEDGWDAAMDQVAEDAAGECI